MNFPRIILAVLGLSFLLAAMPEDSQAYPVYRRYFQDHFGKSTRCEACHEYGGSSNRNAFGNAFQKAGESVVAFAGLDEVDSDGDGFSNLLEAKAGSNPGDERSTPADLGRLWKRALRTIPVPREQLALVMGDSTSLELMEAELSLEQADVVRMGAGVKSEALDLYPTLYFGVKRDTRERVAMFRHFKSTHGLFSILFSVDTSGVLEKAVLFRAGDHSPGDYRAFLGCFSGRTRTNLPSPGVDGCPKAGDRRAEMRGIAVAIQTGLWTVHVLLSDDTKNAALDTSVMDPGDSSDPSESDSESGSDSVSDSDSESGAIAKGAKASAPTRLNLNNAVATQSVSLEKQPGRIGLVLGCMILLLGLIVGTVRLAMKCPGSGGELPRLYSLPSSAKLLVGMVFFSMLCVQSVAAITIIYHTTEVHSSVMEYFSYMSYGRLLGLSHAHIFGFAMMYGVIGLLVCMTDRSELVKCGLIAAILWCGIFDVASWWGMKHFSEDFHLLSYLSGGVSGLASMVAVIVVALGLRAPRETE